ncbi:hypothetical protein ACLB2K_031388 [Fragaria x ananassa]
MFRQAEMQSVRNKLNDLLAALFDPAQNEGKKVLNDKLQELLTAEETIWIQRSKALWLKAGDRNTAFFHRRTSNKKQRNTIKGICSKVLANRLKSILDKVISPFQSAFVPRRLISDDTLVATEVAHFLHTNRTGKDGHFSLKLDISKAYDRLEWEFVCCILLKLGFATEWVELIMTTLTTVSYSFLVNGEVCGLIKPKRGRKLAPEAPRLHHLLFADDSFMFSTATEEECQQYRNILYAYEIASGQRVNFQKGSVAFSRRMEMDRQLHLASILGETWNVAGITIDVSNHDSFKDCLMHLASTMTKHHFARALVILWSIWKNRNSQLWEGKKQRPSDAAMLSLGWLQEFTIANETPAGQAANRQENWLVPASGWLKCNYDGAFWLVHTVKAVVLLC